MSAIGEARVAALTAKAGECCDLQVHSAPWLSATFRGERHAMVLNVSDHAAVDRLLRDLDEHEFALPRSTVVDIIAVCCREDGRRISFEALTIDSE